MRSTAQTIPHHAPSGLIYVKTVEFGAVKVFAGDVVVGSITYTFGTQFTPPALTGDIDRDQIFAAHALAEAVNANPESHGSEHTSEIPCPEAFAKVSGTQVILFGRLPAADFTLTTDIVAAVVATSSAGTVEVTMTEGTKTVTLTATPELVVAVETLVSSVMFVELRTNTGDVFIGLASGDGAQHLKLPVSFDAPPGKVIDLNDFYVDVTVAGEGLAYLATI